MTNLISHWSEFHIDIRYKIKFRRHHISFWTKCTWMTPALRDNNYHRQHFELKWFRFTLIQGLFWPCSLSIRMTNLISHWSEFHIDIRYKIKFRRHYISFWTKCTWMTPALRDNNYHRQHFELKWFRFTLFEGLFWPCSLLIRMTNLISHWSEFHVDFRYKIKFRRHYINFLTEYS